jgi:hypothetical protein
MIGRGNVCYVNATPDLSPISEAHFIVNALIAGVTLWHPYGAHPAAFLQHHVCCSACLTSLPVHPSCQTILSPSMLPAHTIYPAYHPTWSPAYL